MTYHVGVAINLAMDPQKELLDVVAKFTPKIVKMMTEAVKISHR